MRRMTNSGSEDDPTQTGTLRHTKYFNIFHSVMKMSFQKHFMTKFFC